MMKRTILCLAIIYSLMMTTACPSKKGLERAFNESARVANLAEASALVMADFYRQGVIPPEWRDRVADSLDIVVTNGKKFHGAVVALRQKYNDKIKTIPTAELTALDILFAQEVIGPFVDILTQIGLLPAAIANRVMLAFSMLKAAILTISSIFGSGSASYKAYQDGFNAMEVKRYADAAGF